MQNTQSTGLQLLVVLVALVAVSLSLLLAMADAAIAMPLISGDFNETCTFVSPTLPGGACTPQTITPVGDWQQNNANGRDAQWISYTNSGSGGVSPPNDSNNPLVSFFETFTVQAGDTLTLDVWADDTAAVLLDGVLLVQANFVLDGACAAGPIGCEPGENARLTVDNLTAGQHVLQFNIFQLGGDGFGVMWSGQVLKDLTCPDDLLISNYQTAPTDQQFVEIANVGSDPVSLDGCSLRTYDALNVNESLIGDASVELSGTLDPGETFRVGSAGVSGVDVVIPGGILPEPGGLGIYNGPLPPDGAPFDRAPADVTGMTYFNNTMAFGMAHNAVPAHNAIYDCIYGGHGPGTPPDFYKKPFQPLSACFP